jgi:hypothetical protein
MTIIQYELVPIDNHQKVIPLWVKDGGYFQNSQTEQLIGIANEQYLPQYIQVLTEEDLVNVVLQQHEQNPMQKIESNSNEIMTIEEVALMVNDWIVIKREEHE